ncbi:hypothetical protein V8F20_001019 [Naviculisporaceae sp. PSN 640]
MDFHHPPKRKSPRRRDDRVILHFCIENQQPHLKSRPLGIKQKSILATCNYEARRRGVKKLMPIYEARKICPDLVLADGEDLTLFRDVSKRLYSLLRSYSWCGKIERLGLDEVFMDVTDMVAYNVDLLNKNDLSNSWFCLEKDDPTKGFKVDATQFAGCVYPQSTSNQHDGFHTPGNALYTRLILGSHLALYLRLKIEEAGFTTAAGISTNKTLAKLVGNKNKPRNQTTLLALQEDDHLSFMDEHKLRSIPGIGSRITSLLETFVRDHPVDTEEFRSAESALTVGQVRTHPGISPPTLERLLVTPGAEKGLGVKTWCLLHGVDDTAVKPGRDVPTQISIEDTYKGLNDAAEINRELTAIASSLLRRMHVDLVDNTIDNATQAGPATGTGNVKWTAYPRTIRLTTRPYTSPTDNKPYNWARASRSAPLPSFVFSSSSAMDSEAIVEKLVVETLIPLFRKLNPAPKGWNIGLLNICVTNMSGSDGGVASGRDIGDMFRRQEDVLREFRVYDDHATDSKNNDSDMAMTAATPDPTEGKDQDQEEETDTDEDSNMGLGMDMGIDSGMGEQCPQCGHFIPFFALTAHERFHSLGS